MPNYGPATVDLSIDGGDITVTVGAETHNTSVSELREAAAKQNDPWPYLRQQIAVQLDAQGTNFDNVGEIKANAEAGSYLY